jgi:hypothetical protein
MVRSWSVYRSPNIDVKDVAVHDLAESWVFWNFL